MVTNYNCRWPELSRGQLITRLAPEGHRAMVLAALTDLAVDCCVLLGALDQQARLASFDDRLVKAARDRGVDVADG
jgi:hypothetical protein